MHSRVPSHGGELTDNGPHNLGVVTEAVNDLQVMLIVKIDKVADHALKRGPLLRSERTAIAD